MYERIILPTDGSNHARTASERGIGVAQMCEASVHVVSVVDTGLFGSVRLPGDTTSAEEALSKAAEEAVGEIDEHARASGVDVSTTVRSGTPVNQILEFTEEVDGDLIVIASHGRGGIDRMVLGSVTRGVTRLGEVDVLVVDVSSD